MAFVLQLTIEVTSDLTLEEAKRIVAEKHGMPEADIEDVAMELVFDPDSVAGDKYVQYETIEVD